jgi:hypothetical protein
MCARKPWFLRRFARRISAPSFIFSRASFSPAHLCRRKLRFFKITREAKDEVQTNFGVLPEEFDVRRMGYLAS